ncbi:MAG: PaaX family transcriptional regulator C-terminal domain-containing protein [Acidobacteriota bacterium]
MRTLTIIFTLFGGYIMPRGGEIWVSSLIKLLKPFNLSETAVRLALSRMAKQGLIQSRKIGRQSYYSLSEKGKEWMLKGKHRALEREPKPWDKKWRLLVYTIPEELRSLRDTLRDELRRLGYGSLGSSLWISPYDFKEELERIFDKLKVAEYVETFEAKYTGFREEQELISKVWDIRGLERCYKEFYNQYASLLAAHKRKIERKEAVDPGECFVQRFRLTVEFIDIAMDDPMLPLELLPVNWAGSKAKKIYLEYRELLTSEANKFFDSVFESSKILRRSAKRRKTLVK